MPCTHTDPPARASYSSRPGLHPGPERRKRPTVRSLNLLPPERKCFRPGISPHAPAVSAPFTCDDSAFPQRSDLSQPLDKWNRGWSPGALGTHGRRDRTPFSPTSTRPHSHRCSHTRCRVTRCRPNALRGLWVHLSAHLVLMVTLGGNRGKRLSTPCPRSLSLDLNHSSMAAGTLPSTRDGPMFPAKSQYFRFFPVTWPLLRHSRVPL